jgi:Nucleotide modification associated domain 2
MAALMNIYFYKLIADNGGAPCVWRSVLSLAICKPMIRKSAAIGDLIFGFAANSLSPNNRLIYAACVTDKLSGGAYYTTDRHSRREDCIYELKNGRFSRRRGAKHHPKPGDLVHDLGKPPQYPRANVLLSTDFRYFGKRCTAEYKSKFPRIRRAVELLGRGARVHHSTELRDELLAMADWIWDGDGTGKKVLGRPTSAPSDAVCHR